MKLGGGLTIRCGMALGTSWVNYSQIWPFLIKLGGNRPKANSCMSSYSFRSLPEVFATSAEQKEFVAAGLRQGKIRKIRRGLYTTNLVEPLEAVVKRNLWQVVSLICPGGVVSHRTALEGRPSPSGLVTVTGDYERKVALPGLHIRQMKGPGSLDGDAPFILGLHMSSRARFLLECLSGKVYGTDSPFLSSEAVEAFVEKLLLQGEDKLNEIRDLAREVSEPLLMQAEFNRLESIIGALLGTRKTNLVSKTAQARAAGLPYDAHRVELFQTLFQELNAWPVKSRPDELVDGTPFRNIGFYDAYFSNFIEGTEFEIEEAMEIAFENKIPASRPEDAHDVLGTFRIVANPSEMLTRISELPVEEFIDLLKGWHLSVMQGRPDKRPGQFKEVANRAGQTLFVEPDLVVGTLRQGFDLGRAIHTPFGRAAFLMFLVSEVHPFDDGNGRVARAVANAELVAHRERRVLIPTVFRTEYLDALRLISREGEPRTFARMVDQAQEFSFDIDFSNLDGARQRLDAWHAFDTDSESRLRRPR